MNKRKFWWLWALWGAVFLALEGYALYTKELVVPTLSRTTWWLREKYRWLGIVIVVVLVWLMFHLQAECFAGVC